MSDPQSSVPDDDLVVFDHVRAEDAEHVGYLGVTEGGEFVPFDRLRRRRGGPMELADAEALLDEAGLRYLAEPWVLRDEDGTETAVRIIEVRRDAVVVSPSLEDLSGTLAKTVDLTATVELPLPTDRLLPRP